MANTRQAKKRARQAEKHRARNVAQRSMMRSSVKTALKTIEDQDKTAAHAAYRAATAMIDRMAGKGLIHKNAAARHKSRINARLRALG